MTHRNNRIVSDHVGPNRREDCNHALLGSMPHSLRAALRDADRVHVLNAGATAVVDSSGQAKQQGRKRAAAAQQL
jgi:hypothetical protein